MKRQTRYVLFYGIVLLVVGACVGLIVGMNIGGNYFPTFEFGTWTGYEATGMIGLMLGGLLGALSGSLFGRRLAVRKVRV